MGLTQDKLHLYPARRRLAMDFFFTAATVGVGNRLGQSHLGVLRLGGREPRRILIAQRPDSARLVLAWARRIEHC